MKLATPTRFAAPILQALTFYSHNHSLTSALAAMTPPPASRSFSSSEPNTVSTTEGACAATTENDFLEKSS
jgi:hypothetical protein